MNLLKKAFSWVRRPFGGGAGIQQSAYSSHAGEVVTSSSALALSTVWACASLVSGTVAAMPVTVYHKGRSGVRIPAEDSPLYALLAVSPNSDQTAYDFWEYLTLSLELWGNAYAVQQRIGDRLVALQPVDPASMSVTRAADGTLLYRWTDGGGSHHCGPDGMFHVRGLGGDPVGGLSPLSYARNVIGEATAVNRAAGATFSNGLRPSGVLTFDKWLTPEQRKIAEDALVEKFAGAARAGRPMLLEGGSAWHPITISPEDAQMLESRSFSVEELCRFFGVPPFMIGHTQTSASWGTGLEQQVLGFTKFSLARRLRRIEQAVRKQLMTPAEQAAGLRVEFVLEGLLRADSAGRAAYYGAMLGNGVMTVNEVRAKENLPPVAGGDIPRIQAQNVPLVVSMTGSSLKPEQSNAAP